MIYSIYNLQDPGCYIMEKLSFFHDHSMFFVVMILSVVVYIMTSLFLSSFVNNKLLYNESVETFWTIAPGVILVFIALPSLKTLYLMDDLSNPQLTIKVVGHQWFWSYEYSDFKSMEFDSYMKSSGSLENSDFRYLEVDNRLVVPINTPIRVIVTSTDVIHSWTLPSLGVKIDANPGRLNQALLIASRLGLFFGQCSEICGVLHSFMPICMEVTSLESFLVHILEN